MKKIELFIKILEEIVEQVEYEYNLINAGKDSKWNKDQLENVVLPEINELLLFALKGKVLFKYGKSNGFLNQHI